MHICEGGGGARRNRGNREREEEDVYNPLGSNPIVHIIPGFDASAAYGAENVAAFGALFEASLGSGRGREVYERAVGEARERARMVANANVGGSGSVGGSGAGGSRDANGGEANMSVDEIDFISGTGTGNAFASGSGSRTSTNLTSNNLNQIMDWNAELPAPVHRCLHDLIGEQVLVRPRSTKAVESAELTLTYQEFDDLTTRLALQLQSLGVGPGTFVPILFEK